MIGRGQPIERRVPSRTSTVMMTPQTMSDVIADPSRMAMASQLNRILRHPATSRPARTQSQGSILFLGRCRVAGYRRNRMDPMNIQCQPR